MSKADEVVGRVKKVVGEFTDDETTQRHGEERLEKAREDEARKDAEDAEADRED